MDIISEIKKILKEKNINKSISENTVFREDLGLDSLDLMDLVVLAEERLNIQIPDDKLLEIVTVKDFVEIVNGLKSNT